jgi:hypothetical protein
MFILGMDKFFVHIIFTNFATSWIFFPTTMYPKAIQFRC